MTSTNQCAHTECDQSFNLIICCFVYGLAIMYGQLVCAVVYKCVGGGMTKCPNNLYTDKEVFQYQVLQEIEWFSDRGY